MIDISMNDDRQLLVSELFGEVRAALIDKGVLQGLLIHREGEQRMLGNIYKAKVVRVMPEMQAAFVDFGDSKNGFLKLADLGIQHFKGKQIGDYLHAGQTMVVQVIKEAAGEKGARLSALCSIAGNLLVAQVSGLNPRFSAISDETKVAISNKIENESVRQTLLTKVNELSASFDSSPRWIVRTQAEHAEAETIQAEFNQLQAQLLSINNEHAKIGDCVHQATDVVDQIISMSGQTAPKSVVCDQHEFAQRLELQTRQLNWPKISYEKDQDHSNTSLFDRFGVEQQIKQLNDIKVPLSNGGSIFVQQTEALVAIDINSGQVNTSQIRSALQTNLDAIDEIVRQLKLRELAGLVVIDFIDLEHKQERAALNEAVQRMPQLDPRIHQIQTLSPLGLVQLTRERRGQSWEQAQKQACHSCNGLGTVTSNVSLCYEIYRSLQKNHARHSATHYRIVAGTEVILTLQGEQANNLLKLKNLINTPIELVIDAKYQAGKFEIVPSASSTA